jgi:hypothetical protein
LEYFPAAACYRHQIQRLHVWFNPKSGGKRIVVQVGDELHMRYIPFDKYRDYLITDYANDSVWSYVT